MAYCPLHPSSSCHLLTHTASSPLQLLRSAAVAQATVCNRRQAGCQAQAAVQAPTATPYLSPEQLVLFKAVEALLSFKPLFNKAVQQARNRIAKRGLRIGIDIGEEVAKLQSVPWEERRQQVTDPHVQMPDYFNRRFHAYAEGNLSWEAAHQMETVARLVHVPVMDPEDKRLDPQGDARFRSSYSRHLQQLLPQGHPAIEQIVDIGCATGLSSCELLRAFPQAHVTGIDLSPHFLAVGLHLHPEAQGSEVGQPGSLSFKHAAGEATGLQSESVDLVSCSLLMHELPQHASKAIMREARRVLRPGGIFSIMEMDPSTAPFQRLFANPIAFAAFKSTEPWLLDYVSFDMPGALQEAGFSLIGKEHNSPKHKTVVAQKAGSY